MTNLEKQASIQGEVDTQRSSRQFETPKFEAPTWALIVAVYAGWLTTTWYGMELPWWLLFPLGAWFSGWYYSLQHEVIHGHPTRLRWLNDLLGYAPLGLFIPYSIYRATHIKHHTKEILTIPGEDPESFYFDAETWENMPRVLRFINVINNMLIGRLTVGVAITITRFWLEELRQLMRGDLRHLGAWISHAVLVTGVLYWVSAVCGMPIWLYVLCFAYPGLGLTLMRSYTEHRAAADPDHRTATVESPTLMALLYLNNNLHVAHHDQPGMAWYHLPAYYASMKEEFRKENDGFVFDGYRDVIRQYMFAPLDTPVLPGNK